MIRAYDVELFEACRCGADLREYVRDTVVAATPVAAQIQVFEYISAASPSTEVVEVLNRITGDEALMRKVQVVTDRSWRNCVLCVTPESVTVRVGGISFPDGRYDLEATLRYWSRQAEQVFLQLCGEPAEEQASINESLEYLINWTFRRHWGEMLPAEDNNTQSA